MEHEEAQGDAPDGSSEVQDEEENQLHEPVFLLETYQAEPVWRRASKATSLRMRKTSRCY